MVAIIGGVDNGSFFVPFRVLTFWRPFARFPFYRKHLFGLFIYLVILIIRALKKYIRSKDVRAEKSVLKQNLGEVLKDLRTKNKMTQEFVAETIGVSRQAVSKWESGECDPSTSNLIALAKLYRTAVEEILQNIKQ